MWYLQFQLVCDKLFSSIWIEPPFALVCGWRYPHLIIAKGGSFSTVSTLRLYSPTSIACGSLYEQKLQYPVRILEFLVGAGGLREPRCIRSPGRGSQRLHRALGGTRILLAAAPTAPPCFCRWQRSSLLLFESTLAPPFVQQKSRNSSTRFGYWSSWWARVDYASRASKKAPQGLFSPPDYSAGRCCSNPPLRPLLYGR